MKIKQTLGQKLRGFVRQFPDLQINNGTTLHCKLCDKTVSHGQQSQVDQHINSAKHQRGVARQERDGRAAQLQQVIPDGLQVMDGQTVFHLDLSKAFVAADIPLSKIRHTAIHTFLDKYTKRSIPSETHLRNVCVPKLYESLMDSIRQKLRNRYLWVAIDETVDSSKRCIVNIVVGILDVDENISKQKFLLASRICDRVNSSVIACLYQDAVNELGKDFKRGQFLLLLSDAAPYMVKAGKAILEFNPKITHVTCAAHGLHRVCETIRLLFDDVNQLISNCKKIFCKAPERVRLFKTDNPDIPLPPEPIITRWGTWLSAAIYYADHFDNIKKTVNKLCKEDAASIAVTQGILLKPKLKGDLATIKSYYSFLPTAITQLEAGHAQLKDVLLILKKAETEFEEMEGGMNPNIGKIGEKFSAVYEKNEGLSTLKRISAIVEGCDTDEGIKYSPAELAAFKYAPITSVDCERSFSMYKSFYRDNRHNFTEENLTKFFMLYCNNNM